MLNYLLLAQRLKYFILLLFIFSGVFNEVKAQDFSYVYIQGDKKKPIYVKVEGVMMPRLSKNYTLLSRLAPGPMHIDILFQQNEYPSVSFNILVPEHGKRAFLLQKKDSVFALFDIEQNFYLMPGNDISEDHIPQSITNESLAQHTVASTQQTTENSTTTTTSTATSSNSTPLQENEHTTTLEQSPNISDTTNTTAPNFISGISFDNNPKDSIESVSTNTTTIENSIPINTGSETAKDTTTTSALINTDCANDVSSIKYQSYLNTLNRQKSEDQKLGYLLSIIKKDCFTTSQIKELVQPIESDLGKYSALQAFYPKTKDQGNYPSLIELFKEEAWKNQFRKLTNP